MLSSTHQHFNFVTFYSAYFAPERGLLVASSRTNVTRLRERCFCQASLLEGVGWAALGAMFGFFAPEDASRFVDRVAAEDVGDFLHDWRHLIDPEWLKYFNSISEPKKLRTPSFAGEIDIESGSEIFGACLFRASQLNRSDVARAAVAAL